MEDAGAVDNPREGASIVCVDAAFVGLGVELEPGRLEEHRERTGSHRLFFVEELGPVRAATLVQMLCARREDSFAAFTPDTGPVRRQECRVDIPNRPVNRILETFILIFAQAVRLEPPGVSQRVARDVRRVCAGRFKESQTSEA